MDPVVGLDDPVGPFQVAIFYGALIFDIPDNLSFSENNFRVLNPKSLSARLIK